MSTCKGVKMITTHDDINYAVRCMQEQDTIAKEVFMRAILRDKKNGWNGEKETQNN